MKLCLLFEGDIGTDNEIRWAQYFRVYGYSVRSHTKFSKKDSAGIDLTLSKPSDPNFNGEMHIQVKSSTDNAIKFALNYIFNISQRMHGSSFTPIVVGSPPGIDPRYQPKNREIIADTNLKYKDPKEIIKELKNEKCWISPTLHGAGVSDLKELCIKINEFSNAYKNFKSNPVSLYNLLNELSSSTLAKIPNLIYNKFQDYKSRKINDDQKKFINNILEPRPTQIPSDFSSFHEFKAGRGHPPSNRLAWKCVNCGGVLGDNVHSNREEVLKKYGKQ